MKLEFRRCDLRLAHRWIIAGRKGSNLHQNIIIRLTGEEDIVGLGEAAPASTYGESAAGVLAFCKKVDARKLSFAGIAGSMRYLDALAPGERAAKGAFNVALLDGAAKLARQPLCDFLGLGFREDHHVSSFSIGLDQPEVIREKTRDAAKFPVLKLKVGDARDGENLAALRSVAPDKPVRVDANGSWSTKERALEMLEWLARDTRIQLVEQPMPANTGPGDLAWLKERSPLPLFADESYHSAGDAAWCARYFDGVNVKLGKTGGVSGACEALRAARAAGLKTMIGCMVETSILSSAAAHLVELADYLDLDGNLLITNDPYEGVTAEAGRLSFATAAEKWGLRVRERLHGK